MALTLDSVLKSIGLGVGAVSGGGVSSVGAIGLEQKIQGKLEANLSRAGQIVGRYTGAHLFDALAQGASQGNREATGEFLQAHGYDTKKLLIPLILAAGALIWILSRRR